VLLESEADCDFSEALSAEVQPVLSDYGPVLAAAFAWSGPFSIFPDFSRFYLRHMLSASYLCSEIVLDELDSLLLRDVMMFPDLRRTDGPSSQPISGPFQGDVDGGAEDS